MSRPNKKEFLRSVAREQVALLGQGGHNSAISGPVRFGLELQYCIDNTTVYTPAEVRQLVARPPPPRLATSAVSVQQCSTLSAILRLCAEGCQVIALNFASAKHPGGGFLNGSMAQEESLAYTTALYASLAAPAQSVFYSANARTSGLYTDHIIYSPNVPILRDDSLCLLPAPLPCCSFVSAPAVNRSVPVAAREADAAMRTRLDAILAIAALRGGTPSALVLGAWGTGVFRNDAREVAALFHSFLRPGGKYAGVFLQVVFAIIDAPTFAIFNDVFRT